MTMELTVIRQMQAGEEGEVCRLVRRVFQTFVAQLYSEEGVHEFLRYIDPVRMATRFGINYFILLAERSGHLVGMIEVRDSNHVSLLFVDGDNQRQGVGRRLLREALHIARHQRPALAEVSVHSSPNAIAAYERFGFQAEGPERSEHGICFVPMRMRLGEAAKH